MKPSVYDGLLVCQKRCTECLFSNAKVVPDERAAEVIQDCLDAGVQFECHKYGISCRGFYDVHGKDVFNIRLAEAMKGVIFVPLEDLESRYELRRD